MAGFESPDLTDIAFLAARGFRPTPTARRGSLLFFEVPLSEQEAERLLASPEREFIGRVFSEWRRLRREIDLGNGGGGARR